MNAIVKEAPQPELGRLHAEWKSLEARHQNKVDAVFRAKNLREGCASRVEALQIKKGAADKTRDRAHEAWVAAGAEGDAPPLNWSAENQRLLDSAIADFATNNRTLEALTAASIELESQSKRSEERFLTLAGQIYEEHLLIQMERIVAHAAPIAALIKPRDDIHKPNNVVESQARLQARRLVDAFSRPVDSINTPANQLGGGNGGTQAFETALNTWIRSGCDGALV